MSTRAVSLTPQEALARDLIVERVNARHHPRTAHGSRRRLTRRHTRAALLLRRLAERLDPSTARDAGGSAGGAAGGPAGTVAGAAPAHLTGTPHAGSPRPWAAAPRRRAPHRHT